MDENNSFLLEQQQAMKRMREMSARASMGNPHKMPPAPPFVKTAQSNNTTNTSEKEIPESKPKQESDTLDNIISSLNIPFINTLKTDSDVSLILGLLLILLAEKSDRLLLIALVYILL